jgi:hypothetical protein
MQVSEGNEILNVSYNVIPFNSPSGFTPTDMQERVPVLSLLSSPNTPSTKQKETGNLPANSISVGFSPTCENKRSIPLQHSANANTVSCIEFVA